MVNRLLIMLLILLLSSLAVAKELTAQVDRFEIGINESVELVVALADAGGQRPNLTELYKDFSVDHQSQSSNITVVNGVMSQQVRWSFLLSPNKKGTLTIPALKVGSLSTDPIEIKVGDGPVAQSTSDDVMMEVEVRPLHPYVQGQVIYIQRLYYSRPLVDNASISSPALSTGEADIEFLGSSNPRYIKHNGRPYQLIERYYAVFPKQAGPLHFEPSVFRGSLASSSARQNRFTMPMFNNGTRVSAYSAKAELMIGEQAASFTGKHWLPASQVTLNMNWSRPPDSLQAGEPVTVTIALMAEGVKAETLPEVILALPDSLKVYPDQPSFRSDKGGNGLAGLREEKFTLVGNENAEYQIPAVEVPWWNTNTDQQEVARLGAFTIKVGGAVAGSKPAQAQTAVPATQEVVKNDAVALVDTVASQTIAGFYGQNKSLILAVLVGLLGLLATVYFWRKRAIRPVSVVESKQERQEAIKVLTAACKENNPTAAIAALPGWANTTGIIPATLRGIECCGDMALTNAISELSQANYSQQTGVWRGDALLKAINDYVPKKSTMSDSTGLSPLHPIG